MKHLPSTGTVFDLFLEYIANRYTDYHVLPDSQLLAMDLVTKVLKETALKYKAKHNGEVPILCIDSVDLLAKHDRELCCKLVTIAKVMAKDNLFQIILVGSDGTIMTLIKGMSAMNRAFVYEIGDLGDDEAERYLMMNNVPQDKASEVVQYVGGRLVYLQSVVELMKLWKGLISNKVICKTIKEEIFFQMLGIQRSLIYELLPESVTILKEISKAKEVSTETLMKKSKNCNEMKTAISELIDKNIIRYTSKGFITWHSKVQEQELSEMTKE